jgi:hypothetical protein
MISLESELYSFCYPENKRIITDPDEEKTGEPYCDGQCNRCSKSWGDEDSGI